jgi:transcriptional antiterminator
MEGGGRVKIEQGSKVTYKTPHKTEKGIVKSIPDKEHAFVVYHCGGDWNNYENYTAARTRISDLKLG